MQTHDNADFNQNLSDLVPGSQDLKELADKAKTMIADGRSTITAGAPDEEVIAEKLVGTIMVRRLPDDPHCLRISVGEGHRIADSAYLVFRGDPSDIESLLVRALAALRVSGYC